MNSDSNNAFTNPANVTEAPAKLVLTEMAKTGEGKKWILELHPQHLALFTEADPQPFVFPRQEIPGKMDFLPGLGTLVLKAPQNLTFRMVGDSARTLARWMGPPTREQLISALKGIRSFARPIALLLVLLAILPGGLSKSSQYFSTHPVPLVLGSYLLIVWALARWRPHPRVFVLDGIWWLMLSLYLFWMVYKGASGWWAVLAAFDILIALGGYAKYRQFTAHLR